MNIYIYICMHTHIHIHLCIHIGMHINIHIISHAHVKLGTEIGRSKTKRDPSWWPPPLREGPPSSAAGFGKGPLHVP